MPGVGTLAYGNTAKPYRITMLTPTGTVVPVREQSVTYTSYQRPAAITENGVTATFAYNAAGDRAKMQVKRNGSVILSRYYIGKQYELDVENNIERLYLGGDAYSAPAVYVKEANVWKIYYICRDYLGSITHVANADGSLKQELSYDAWGRLRNPATQVAYTPGNEPILFLRRGYTGHEHLYWFGLINMNARLYDPALGRFLSPDPYVQMPDFTQNFNRYSYCLNNPLVYVDINGEWFGIDDLFVAAAGWIFGYVSHGISTGNWGWNAVGSGFMSAASAWLGFNTMGVSLTAGQYIGNMAINTVASYIIPSMNIPISNNFSLNISLGVGMGPNGLIGSMNFGGIYHNGDFSVGIGFGLSDNYYSYGANISFGKDFSLGYYRTHYGNATGPDFKPNKQIVGGLTISSGKFSFRIENDFLGDRSDRWRSNALEVGWGNFVVGTNLYNNNPKGEKTGVASNLDYDHKGYNAWRNGRTYSSPLYIGIKSGKNVYRFGYSHPQVQNWTQNWVHKNGFFGLPFGYQNYYLKMNIRIFA